MSVRFFIECFWALWSGLCYLNYVCLKHSEHSICDTDLMRRIFKSRLSGQKNLGPVLLTHYDWIELPTIFRRHFQMFFVNQNLYVDSNLNEVPEDDE